jgi:hypothetical protein
MNKRFMIPTVALLAAMVLIVPVCAGATKFVPTLGGGATGTESGFFIVNDADGVQTVIEIQVRGLPLPATYYAYIYDIATSTFTDLGVLTVNKAGSGHFHANVAPCIPRPYYLGVGNAPSPLPPNQILWVLVP